MPESKNAIPKNIKISKVTKVTPRRLSEVSLALQGWHITGINSDIPGQYIIEIEMDNPQWERCSNKIECEDASQPRRFGSTIVHIRDLPMHGKFVDLQIKRQRYQCKYCKAVSGSIVHGKGLGPDIHASHRMTMRLVNYIYDQAASQTFTQVGNNLGLSDITVKKVFFEQESDYSKDGPIIAPRILGIDDKYINKRWYTVFVDLEKRVLLDIYEGKSAEKLRFFVERMGKDLCNIKAVCQDMSPEYRVFSETYLPDAKIVIDKFHVIMNLNAAVDAVRLDVKKGMNNKEKSEFASVRKAFLLNDPPGRIARRLEKWLSTDSQFKKVYEAKEKFFGFYDCDNSEVASHFYKDWLSVLDIETKEYFKGIIDCMSGASKLYILNYFEYKITSGFLEALNGQIKRMAGCGINYRYDVLRLKLLRRYGPGKVQVQRFKRASQPNLPVTGEALRPSQPKNTKSQKKPRRGRIKMPAPPLGTRQGRLDLVADDVRTRKIIRRSSGG